MPQAILDAAACTLWAIDRDPDAIARGAALLARHPGRLHLIEGRFGDMLELLARTRRRALDGVVLDLGVSSFQLDEPARGFCFRADGPLDMRMGRDGPTAADLVNTLPERELADTAVRVRRGTAVARASRAPSSRRAPRRRSPPPSRLAGIIRSRGAAGPLRHRPGDAQLPGAAHPRERRTRRDRRARSTQAARLLRAGRAAGRGGVPFAGGPAGEALHGRGRRPRAGAVAP